MLFSVDRENIGLKLREWRERNGFTQQEIAQALDVNWVSVGRWERGQSTPTRHFAKRLAELIEKD